MVALDFVLGQRPLCVLQHHVEQGEVIERRHNVADRNDVAALCRNGVGVVQRLDLLIGQFAAVDGAGMISERDLRIAGNSAAVRNPFFGQQQLEKPVVRERHLRFIGKNVSAPSCNRAGARVK